MRGRKRVLPVLASQRKQGMVGETIQKSVGRLYLFLLRGLADRYRRDHHATRTSGIPDVDIYVRLYVSNPHAMQSLWGISKNMLQRLRTKKTNFEWVCIGPRVSWLKYMHETKEWACCAFSWQFFISQKQTFEKHSYLVMKWIRMRLFFWVGWRHRRGWAWHSITGKPGVFPFPVKKFC